MPALRKTLPSIAFALLLLGVAARVYVALHFQSRAWIDEIWVVLDPAYRLFTQGISFPLGPVFEDPLERGIRSWVAPFLVYAYLKLISILGLKSGPAVLPALRLGICLFNLVALLVFVRALARKLKLSGPPLVPWLVVLFTPDFIHYSTTADLSVLGLPVLLLGLAAAVSEEDQAKPTRRSRWGGALLAASALIRFQ